MPQIQVIEDEEVLGRSLSRALERDGHQVVWSRTVEAALTSATASSPDLALCDLRLPDGSGIDVLRRLRELYPELPVVIMTAFGSVPEAVDAIRAGAVDYLQKPLDLGELRLLVERTLDARNRRRELRYLREQGAPDHGVIGEDPRLARILEQVDRLRSADLAPGKRPPILLTGETGTGKGLFARTLHERLGGGPFIDINCTALPASLLEAELFGHERGSFTDAKSDRDGLFLAAEGGTLFLDEIGHLAIEAQGKLLVAIEDRRIRRIGADRDREVDVHIMAATNRDLDAAVGSGEFRADLRHRLSVLSFEIPPLRERGDDTLRLARAFASELGRRYGDADCQLSEAAERLLMAYRWPGNVRELRNVLERAVLLSPNGGVDADLLAELLGHIDRPTRSNEPFSLPDEGVRLDELERDLIVQALGRVDGNQSRAAKLLGLSRYALRYRMEKHRVHS